MNKLCKRLLALVTMSLVAVMPCVAFADGNVTYEGQAENFIFEPGSEYSPTDLFDTFKGVMPGDSITQKVNVKNNASEKVYVKIYMRALGAVEGSEEFLSKLNLTVTSDNELFNAPADQTAGLTDWYCLGTFYSGDDMDLDVTLNVPIDLDNKFQDAIGYLDWQFKVEEFEIPVEEEPEIPEEDTKMGDNANLLLYAGIAGLSAVAIILLAKKRRSENK